MVRLPVYLALGVIQVPWFTVHLLLWGVGLRWVAVGVEATLAAALIDVPRSLLHPRRPRLWGFYLYVGNKGKGKTASMVEHLWRLRRRWGDAIEIYTNFEWEHEDGPILGPDHLIAAQFATRPTVFAFDEIAQEFDQKAYERMDEEWISFLTQQRKWGECGVRMLGAAQRANMTEVTFRRLADFIIECKSYAWNNRRYVSQEWFDGIENYMDGHDAMNGFRRERCKTYQFHFHDGLRRQYGSFSRVKRLTELAESGEVDFRARRHEQVQLQLQQLAALRESRMGPGTGPPPASAGAGPARWRRK